VGLQQHGACRSPCFAYFAGLAWSAAGCLVLRACGIRRCGASVAADAFVAAPERAASVAADALTDADAGAGLLASVAADAWLVADAGGGGLRWHRWLPKRTRARLGQRGAGQQGGRQGQDCFRHHRSSFVRLR
jgi:hypothetical protein